MTTHAIDFADDAARADRSAATSLIRDLRLLIVADSSTTHTQRWAHWFRDRGTKLTVLSPFTDPIEGVEVIPFPGRQRLYHRIPKLRVALDYVPFRRLLRRINPDLIHFHFICEGGRGFYWDFVPIPMIATSWGQDVIFDHGASPRAERRLRHILALCRIITATSHQLAAATARYAPPDCPIYLTPFGVDLDRFPLRRSLPREEIILGFVKHLLPKYGPDILIEAFARIHRERPATRLILAGRGPMREPLQRRVDELRLTSAVRFLGRVVHEGVPELIRGFDIMVMPSVYESETFGVAAIEASASGVPVVASRVGGVPEAVLHEQTGLLVPPRDADALAEACIRLIDDPAARQRLGLAGRRFVERYYLWQDNAASMEELYRALLEGDSPRGVPVFRPGVEPDLTVP